MNHQVVVCCVLTGFCDGKKAGQKSLDEVVDLKEFKKLLKIRTSVLVCFTKSAKESQFVTKLLGEVAEVVRGTGTIVTVDCGGYILSFFIFNKCLLHQLLFFFM